MTELTLRLTKETWPRTTDQLETIDLTVADDLKWITWVNLTTIRLVYVNCESEGCRNWLRRGRRLWYWFRKRNVSGLTGTPDDVRYSKAWMRYWNGWELRKRPSALRKLCITFSLQTRTIGGRNPKTQNLWLELHWCRTTQAVIVRHCTQNSQRKRKFASAGKRIKEKEHMHRVAREMDAGKRTPGGKTEYRKRTLGVLCMENRERKKCNPLRTRREWYCRTDRKSSEKSKRRSCCGKKSQQAEDCCGLITRPFGHEHI